MSNRAFPWLLLLLIAAGAFFGLGPFMVPGLLASIGGYAGEDLLAYRLAGAATFGYAVGLAIGYRASWPELRVPIAATAVFNLASIFGCLVSIAGGNAQPIVYVILLASILFSASCLYYLRQPPTDRVAHSSTLDHALAPWVIALFAFGTISALLFGFLALIPAGSFGSLAGYPGMDDFIYRQGGAATLGVGVGGLLVLLNRRWATARIPTVMAVTFDGLAVVAVLLDIAAGTAQAIAYVIMATSGLLAVGSALALYRGGR